MWTAQMIEMKAGPDAICAAAARSAGVSRPRSAPRPRCRTSRWSASSATRASTITWPSSRRRRATKLNVVIVVNTNYSGGVLENVAYEKSVNFAKVADAMGCVGFRVEKPADIRGRARESARGRQARGRRRRERSRSRARSAAGCRRRSAASDRTKEDHGQRDQTDPPSRDRQRRARAARACSTTARRRT